MPLDPAKGAREQLESVFRRARRLRRGAEVARTRLEETRAALQALGELKVRAREAVALGTAEEALRALEGLSLEAKRRAPLDFKLAEPEPTRGERRGEGERCPYRTFLGARDRRILVGRGAQDNDVLTTRIARPQDLWLHAKGCPGAHVVVPLDRGEACPPELLLDAAHLAAHFSEARGSSPVEVQHTPRRHVRKPKGAPPGAVHLGREKVLVLRLEPQRLSQLLTTEQA
jgi:predicted ribosome quality control (RQC) complex YloA/Tae2 family protein